jgi:hypothetical protein
MLNDGELIDAVFFSLSLYAIGLSDIAVPALVVQVEQNALQSDFGRRRIRRAHLLSGASRTRR